MINVTTKIDAVLETAIAKPPTRNRWSRRAVARYLGSQGLLGSDKNTIAKWEVLLRVVKPYRERIPRDARGNFLSGYSLDWTLDKREALREIASRIKTQKLVSF